MKNPSSARPKAKKTNVFSEEAVHKHIFKVGLEHLIEPEPFDDTELPSEESFSVAEIEFGEQPFELWRVVKQRAIEKIIRQHRLVRYGEFVGSKIKLPTNRTTPMELDLLGLHDEGVFVLELKVEKGAERNAFSELFAYSNYLAGMFALSGHRDITNVLVAELDAKISQQAYLYDLLIGDRNIVVYRPKFADTKVSSLSLKLHIPSDGDFKLFANRVLSHDAMSCAVISFHNVEGWIDSAERPGEDFPDYTRKHLTQIGAYAAQLMEAENLHGFCFIRKRWKEVELFYENSLVLCALNPFNVSDHGRADAIRRQIKKKDRDRFFEVPSLGFDSRLAQIAQRAIRDGIGEGTAELEFPAWLGMVHSMIEVVLCDNFAFHSTGMFREAYVKYITEIYRQNELCGLGIDVEHLKILEVSNWLRAWEFLESCGLSRLESDECQNMS